MTDTELRLNQQADSLYEQYARPLEPARTGEFVAVSLDGRTILGSDLRELAATAKLSLGPGSFIFKIGERAIGKWR